MIRMRVAYSIIVLLIEMCTITIDHCGISFSDAMVSKASFSDSWLFLVSISVWDPSDGAFSIRPFLCPSRLCLGGRFGVPFKGPAGHRAGCFWLWFLGFWFGFGNYGRLVVILGCMGIFCFIFFIELLLLFFFKESPGQVGGIFF